MDRALSIVVGHDGVLKITVHRDPAQDYSAKPGLALLERLFPLIQELDDRAATAPVREADTP